MNGMVRFNPNSAIGFVNEQLPHWLEIFHLLRRSNRKNLIAKSNGLLTPAPEVLSSVQEWIYVLHKATVDPSEDKQLIRSKGLINNIAGKITAIINWQFTKGRYVVNDELLTAIQQTPTDVEIPTAIFRRLPEYAIYIDLPEPMTFAGQQVIGFFATLSENVSLELTKSVVELIIIPCMVNDELAEKCFAIKLSSQRSIEWFLTANIDKLPPGNESSRPFVTFLFQILLYICSEQPDITDRKAPTVSIPSTPRLNHRKGLMQPAKKPRTWMVGANIGRTIKANRQRVAEGTLKPGRKSPHIRRAHWHGYWTGPRKGEQEMLLKWIPPVLVGCV